MAEIAAALNRDAIYLRGLLGRFGLPSPPGGDCPPAVEAFPGAVVGFRALGISEEDLRELWETEKKLLELLHMETSPALILDGWRERGGARRRLFLTRADLGADLSAGVLQPGLDFNPRGKELFSGREMGEDALRVLREALRIPSACNLAGRALHRSISPHAGIHPQPRHDHVLPDRKHSHPSDFGHGTPRLHPRHRML